MSGRSAAVRCGAGRRRQRRPSRAAVAPCHPHSAVKPLTQADIAECHTHIVAPLGAMGDQQRARPDSVRVYL